MPDQRRTNQTKVHTVTRDATPRGLTVGESYATLCAGGCEVATGTVTGGRCSWSNVRLCAPVGTLVQIPRGSRRSRGGCMDSDAGTRRLSDAAQPRRSLAQLLISTGLIFPLELAQKHVTVLINPSSNMTL